MLDLRTKEGLDLAALSRDFEEEPERALSDAIRELTARKLATCEGSRLVWTLDRWLQADRIAAALG